MGVMVVVKYDFLPAMFTPTRPPSPRLRWATSPIEGEVIGFKALRHLRGGAHGY